MKLNILMVVTNADLAGAPIHVRDLALSLHKDSHSVCVVFGENGPIQEQLKASGISTACIPTLRSNINLRQDINAFFALSTIVRRVKPDFLHMHSSKAGLIGRLVSWRFGLPSIYTIHGWGFGSGRRKHIAIFVWLTELLCRQLTNRYITVSNADRLIGLNRLKIQPERIETIYNGCAFIPEQSKKSTDRLILIMVARNEYPKDYLTLFKALSISNFDEMLLVGKGTDTREFIEQAKKTIGNNVSKVSFLGAQSDIEPLLSRANVMILSSHFEGLPISLIEGMSKGLPLIASNVGGIPELVKNNINGWLFEPGDSETLAMYINKIFHEPEPIKRMGNSSLQHFKANFKLDIMVKKTVHQYKLLASANPPKQSL